MTPITFSTLAPLAGGFLALDSTDTWVLAAFILFGLLLTYMGAPKAITGALDARAEGIRAQLAEARELREEAQRKLAEFERKHAEVARQAEEIVERAKKEANAAAEEAKAAIDQSVAQRLQAAEDQIAMAEADAVRAVRNVAIDAASEASHAVLKATILATDQSKLLDAAIKETGSKAH
ncbi:MAG: ATP F0F1 synthase subunit B [Pseudomonadota bacterium]